MRPDAVPVAVARFGRDSDPPATRRAGEDAVREMEADVDLEADDDVGAA